MLPHHHKLRSTAVLVALTALIAQPALAISSGNGGGQPPAQYNSTLPTLSNGQTTYHQTDNRGRIIVSPSSFPTVQPISAATTLPVSAATTIPTHEQGTATVTGTVNVGNYPSTQGVVPVPSASPFPITPASGSQFTVNGTTNVGNFPAFQLVRPDPSASPFPINCVTGCSGGSGGSGGVYNSALPTYTSGQSVVPQYDSNGRAIISPFTISLPGPLPVAGQYNNTLPSLTSGTYGAFGLDNNGLILLSPQSNIQTGGGIYQLNPVPLADGQVTQVRTDSLGHTMVVAATPLPITMAQTGNPIDRSNKIAVASGTQLMLPYDLTRHGFMMQNTSSGDLWINLNGTAASAGSPSYKVPTFTTFTTPPYFPASNPVQIWGATANATFSVTTW